MNSLQLLHLHLGRLFPFHCKQKYVFRLIQILKNFLSQEIPKKKLDLELPFVNRKTELLAMAKVFLHNTGVNVGNANTEKWKLVITSQMFGSGKTALGINFLEAIKQYASELDTSMRFFLWLCYSN